MALSTDPQSGEESNTRLKTPAEQYEGIAFTFCKAATLVLLTQKYAMIVTAGGATVFYLMAHFHGQRETRCMLRKPLISAGFWGVICLAASYVMFRPLFEH